MYEKSSFLKEEYKKTKGGQLKMIRPLYCYSFSFNTHTSLKSAPFE